MFHDATDCKFFNLKILILILFSLLIFKNLKIESVVNQLIRHDEKYHVKESTEKLIGKPLFFIILRLNVYFLILEY